MLRAWLVEAETAGDATLLGKPGEHFRNTTIRVPENCDPSDPPEFDVDVQLPQFRVERRDA